MNVTTQLRRVRRNLVFHAHSDADVETIAQHDRVCRTLASRRLPFLPPRRSLFGDATPPLTRDDVAEYRYEFPDPANLIDDGHGWGWAKKAWKWAKKHRWEIIAGIGAAALCVGSAGLGCAVAAGAAMGAATGVGKYVTSGKKITFKGVLKAAVGGAVGGAIGGAAGFGAGKALGAVISRSQIVKGALSKVAASCKANSFTAATLVKMADGSEKKIQDVKVGDMVMAADPTTGERGPRRVTATIVGEGHKELVDIEIDGEVLTATDGHPFWVDDQGRWVDAEDLESGDLLLLDDGSTVAIDFVSERTELRRVHNLTVEGIHTYFVVAGDDPILVHNCAFPRDFSTPNTLNRSALFGSEGEARALARTKLGANAVDVGENKLRSANGVWQFRARMGDVLNNHVHLERLNSSSGEVLENWHLYWPDGMGR